MMEIEVQHYQKQWPILFEIEQLNIKAKPIIDMLVVVTNIEKIDDYNDKVSLLMK